MEEIEEDWSNQEEEEYAIEAAAFYGSQVIAPLLVYTTFLANMKPRERKDILLPQ
jgi:hypothetical protein